MGVPFVLLLGFAPLQKCTYHGKGLCITHEICLFLGNPPRPVVRHLYLFCVVVVWSWIPWISGGGGAIFFFFFFSRPPPPPGIQD